MTLIGVVFYNDVICTLYYFGMFADFNIKCVIKYPKAIDMKVQLCLKNKTNTA